MNAAATPAPPAAAPAPGPTWDVEALRSQLASQHRITLEAADPIFVAVALNDLVLQRYVAHIEQLNRAAQLDAVAKLAEQVDAAKQAAALLITHSAQYVADEVRTQINGELARACAQGMSVITSAEGASRTALWAAAIAILMTGIGLGALLIGAK